MATKDADKASHTISVRLTPEQNEEFQRRARKAGLSSSDFVRAILFGGGAADGGREPGARPPIDAGGEGTPRTPELADAARSSPEEAKRLKLVLKTAENCYGDLQRLHEVVRELRHDVVTAIRLLVLFMSNREPGQGTELDPTELDKLLADAFPHRSPSAPAREGQ